MALCYFCNNVANHSCASCNLPICDVHAMILEKQESTGGSEVSHLCPNCAD